MEWDGMEWVGWIDGWILWAVLIGAGSETIETLPRQRLYRLQAIPFPRHFAHSYKPRIRPISTPPPLVARLQMQIYRYRYRLLSAPDADADADADIRISGCIYIHIHMYLVLAVAMAMAMAAAFVSGT